MAHVFWNAWYNLGIRKEKKIVDYFASTTNVVFRNSKNTSGSNQNYL